MPQFNAEEIDVKSRMADPDFDIWLQKNLEIIQALLMNGRDFYFDVAAGSVDDHDPVHVVSHDTQISTKLASIGNNLGELQAWSTTAAIDSLSSESIADVHDMIVAGLDINYEPVAPQTITLTGQTRVAIPIPLFRITELATADGVSTQGIIWCYENTALADGKPVDIAKIRSSIHMTAAPSGANFSFERHTTSQYTVPAGYEAFVVFGKTSVSDGKALFLAFWGSVNGKVFKMLHPLEIKDNTYDYFFKLPSILPEKTDLEVRGYVSSGTAVVTANYDIILKKKPV